MLLFCWKGAAVRCQWIGGEKSKIPTKESLRFVCPVLPWLRRMLPFDRQYLSVFYEAASFVLARDGERDDPILATTADFTAFHAGSLDLAVADGRLADCPALCESFVEASGPGLADITEPVRRRLADCCDALSHVLRINDG